ncbi:MAG TPA: methyltransferase domain-containing protein [Burkholderiales bacterium]|nr:methyltransferase domain-containing protein [Burkholderiales bacterium]
MSESAAVGFESPRESWDAKYATDEYIFGTAPNVFLASEATRFRPDDRVLAVADGEGRNGVWLAERGCQVLSVDISAVALEKARRLAGQRGVSLAFEIADLGIWQWPREAFDAIVCIFIQFAAPAERARLFDGFRQALKPGGIVLMEGYNPKQLQYRSGGPGKLEHLYTEQMLKDAFAGWEILLLREYEAELDEGPKHRGMAALIDLIARKRD